MKQRRRFWLWAVAALVAGLILRLWFVDHMARVVGDSLVYGDIAKTWLQHGIYGLSTDDPTGARPTLIRLPGYPMFLAACFRLFGMENYRAVLEAQVAIDLVHLLPRQRARRTPLWPPRTAARSVDRGTLSLHRELHVHRPRRDACVRHHRPRLLWICALAGCWSRL